MWEKSGLIFLLPVAGYVLYFAKLVLCVSLLLLPNLFQYKLQTFPIAAAVLHFLITVLCYLLPFFLTFLPVLLQIQSKPNLFQFQNNPVILPDNWSAGIHLHQVHQKFVEAARS